MKFDLDLNVISDSDLLAATKCLASEERRIGIEVLHHLREIDARKLFASLGFSSLFSYCTTELGYSEGGAYRRIAAMRLLREVPEYETKLEKGEVSVATLSQVQSFLVQEKRQLGKTYSSEEKLELHAKVEGKSAHQTERVLAAMSPQLVRDEKARVIGKKKRSGGPKKTETAGATKFIGPSLPLVEVSQSLPPVEVGPQMQEKGSQGNGQEFNRETNEYEDRKVVTRYISMKIRNAVWRRDDGRCTFVSPSTGRRCDSRHALELEHIRPFAMGGDSSFENLKLLCSAPNQHTAIQTYGLGKMESFWKK